ncbi:MAG: hypothetical protein KGL39_05490 [Patescibacteria group bacterium]|nr:hypothetical protein [Patescibacteria group bacterium]
MDETLRQILMALFRSHQEIDELRLRVAELEQALREMQSSQKTGGS